MAVKIGNISSIASIPTDDLRDIWRQTMVMGLPETEADRPTFYFDREVAWADHDSADKPWDYTDAPVTDTTADSVQAICVYEFAAPFGRQGALFERSGEYNQSTLTITMFEDEFESVTDSSYVTIGPGLERKWWFRYWKPAASLNDLTAYEAIFASEDT